MPQNFQTSHPLQRPHLIPHLNIIILHRLQVQPNRLNNLFIPPFQIQELNNPTILLLNQILIILLSQYQVRIMILPLFQASHKLNHPLRFILVLPFNRFGQYR